MTRLRFHPAEAALLVVLAASLVPFVLTTYAPIDEFLNLSHGLRTLRGEVIYKDFFEFTPPLSHWLPAALFALFGPSLLVARLAVAALLLGSAWLMHRCLRLLDVGPWLATLPALMLVWVLHREMPGYSHHWVILPAMLGAMWAAFEGVARPERRWWLGAGLAAGLAVTTLQTDGLMLGAALAAWCVLVALTGGSSWPEAARRLGLGALGLAAPVVVVALALASRGALGDALYHVWTWPLQHYKQSGAVNDVKLLADLAGYLSPLTRTWVSLPYWYARVYHYGALALAMPLAALTALAWGLGRLMPGGKPLEAEGARRGLLAVLCVGTLATLARGKADIPHVVYYAYPALMWLTLLAEQARRAPAPVEWALLKRLPVALLAVWCGTGVWMQAQAVRQAPERWCRLESPDRLAALPVFAYLRAHTGKEDRIAGLPCAALFYFYGPRPASRYTLVLPPSSGYNDAEEQAAFWREVQTLKPKYVVVAPLWDGPDGLALTVPTGVSGYRRLAQPFSTPIGDGEVQTWLYERTPTGEAR